jgi:transposase-like protein
MPRKSPNDVTDVVVERYLAGALVSQIAEEVGLARSTVNKILQRSGKVPQRFAAEAETSTEQLLAGLRELVRYLEQQLDESERENRSLKRKVAALQQSAVKSVS